MKNRETGIFTKDVLEAGKSSRGAWSGEQLRLFGLNIKKLPKGWQKRLIGKHVEQWRIDEFLALKDAHIGRPSPIYTVKFTDGNGHWFVRYNPTKGVTDPASVFDAAISRMKCDDEEDALTAEFLHVTNGI